VKGFTEIGRTGWIEKEKPLSAVMTLSPPVQVLHGSRSVFPALCLI